MSQRLSDPKTYSLLHDWARVTGKPGDSPADREESIVFNTSIACLGRGFLTQTRKASSPSCRCRRRRCRRRTMCRAAEASGSTRSRTEGPPRTDSRSLCLPLTGPFLLPFLHAHNSCFLVSLAHISSLRSHFCRQQLAI